jgi:hypothetical protein
MTVSPKKPIRRLTKKEVATRLNLSTRSLERMCQYVSFTRVTDPGAKQVFFYEDEIDCYLEHLPKGGNEAMTALRSYQQKLRRPVPDVKTLRSLPMDLVKKQRVGVKV